MTTAHTTPTPSEYLLARITETESAVSRLLEPGWTHDGSSSPSLDDTLARAGRWSLTFADVLAQCRRDRRIIELHDQWPVLVETPPTLEPPHPTDINTMTMRMTQQIAWQTEQLYRERFGTEPPTAPIIAAMLEVYADRDDFPEDWKR